MSAVSEPLHNQIGQAVVDAYFGRATKTIPNTAESRAVLAEIAESHGQAEAFGMLAACVTVALLMAAQPAAVVPA